MSHFFHQHPFVGMFMAFYAGIYFSAYQSAKQECHRTGETFNFFRRPTWSEITGWALLAGFIAVPMFVHYIGVPLFCAYEGCPSNIWMVWGMEFLATISIYGMVLKVLNSFDNWKEKRSAKRGDAIGDGYKQG